ncbi:hypothetical protein GCM10010172_09960 [Paractinoplanes ferrugineus]|uniref:Condensation domain-containing protein n=1 Tax=Paractinoplanes ferrugineus TaxID=113564 RepID=A0A919IW62_9ACTN|nr:hypothetical protein [Actinoplanes ferrugineus]GIE09560.1 hypothetical protein Afe05nite_14000 [Actinoplanes ferrugineus]
MSATDLTASEQSRLPYETIRTVGPFYGVTAERMRAALIGLHAADPTHRVVSRLDRAGPRWEHLDAEAFALHAGAAVSDLGDWTVDFDEATSRLQAEPRGAYPLRIVVGAGYVAFKVSNAYGDAEPVNELVHELVRAAAEGRTATFPPAHRHIRYQLVKTWWQRFGLWPAREVATPVSPAAELRDWAPQLTQRSDRSGEILRHIRQWRDRTAPGVTTTAITFAAFVSALRDLGLDPDLSGAVVHIDARRYLARNARVDSNFSMGVRLSPRDLTDPGSVHETLQAELASGRVLGMMLRRSARIAVTGEAGTPGPYPSKISTTPRPRLTLSNQGRHDLLSDLPWTVDAGSRANLSVPTHSDPEGITLTTSELDGALHLEATFHASTYDPELITRALDVVCTNPAGILAHR